MSSSNGTRDDCNDGCSIHQIQTIRTSGQYSGVFSLVCTLIIIYALIRLLTSSTTTNNHHPKITGTHSYFTLLLLATIGDCFTAVGTSMMITLPLNTNNSTNTVSPHVSSLSCTAQGFILELGCTISVVFSSLVAVEMYNLRPQIGSNANIYDSTVPIFQRHLTKVLLAGFSIVVFQILLAGGLYGYGNNNPESRAWCWLQDETPIASFVGIFFLVSCSIIIIVTFTILYLCHIKHKLLQRTLDIETKKKARRTFAKLAVYPLLYVIAWSPPFVHRLLGSVVTFSTNTDMIIDAIHIVLVGSIGLFNFIFLSCMNRQVRSFLPGWKYWCANGDGDGGRGERFMSTVSSTWDSSEDEEEEDGQYIQM